MPSSDLFHVYAKVLNGCLTLKTKPGIPSALRLLFLKAVKNDRVTIHEHSFESSKLFLYMFNKEWAYLKFLKDLKIYEVELAYAVNSFPLPRASLPLVFVVVCLLVSFYASFLAWKNKSECEVFFIFPSSFRLA